MQKKWYQKTGWIIAILYFFFPVGIGLLFGGSVSDNESDTTIETSTEEVIDEVTEIETNETEETSAYTPTLGEQNGY